MRALARLMQLVGLTLLPLSIVLELSSDRFGTAQMLIMLVAGISAFYIGRILEGYSSG